MTLRLLKGTTSKVQTRQHNGRDHYVVPVVALMEGVIHAVNAPTAEFVPLSVLSQNVDGWTGKPVMLGHPTRGGVQISASDPVVLAESGLGTVFNPRIDGAQLKMEAWIDPEKVRDVTVLERIRNGEPIEVSIGAFVATESEDGEQLGRPYKAKWLEITPDHLALLPHSVGACSLSMGCGANRAAEAALTAEDVLQKVRELLVLGGPGSGNFGHAGRPGQQGGSAGDGGGGDSSKSSPEAEAAAARSADIAEAQVKAVTTTGDWPSEAEHQGVFTSGDKRWHDPRGTAYLHNDKNTEGINAEHANAASAHDMAYRAQVMAAYALKQPDTQGYYNSTNNKTRSGHEMVRKEAVKEATAAYKATKASGATGAVLHEAGMAVKAAKAGNFQEAAQWHLRMRSEHAMAATLANRVQGKGFAGKIEAKPPVPRHLEVAELRELEDESLDEQVERIRQAVRERFSPLTPGLVQPVGFWVEKVFEDRVIAESSGQYFSIPYVEDGDSYKFGVPVRVEKVTSYEEIGNQGAAGGGEEVAMTKEQKAAIITALGACPCGGYEAKFLEGLSDEQLLALEANTKARAEKRAADQAELEGLRVAAAKPKTMTEEEFLAAAPESIRTLVADKKAQDAKRHDELVTALKAAQSEYSEEELKALELKTLERLGKIALAPKPDYSGKGVVAPRAAASATGVYEAPDPYRPAA